MSKTSQILQLMTQTAKQAGEIVAKNFRHDDKADNKTSHRDIVTQTDLDSQQKIHDLLLAGMIKLGFAESEVGFIEEESKDDQLKKYNFVVDPIDGTTNFAAGIPYACISIGYAVDHNLELGVVYDPFSETLFWGEKGSGSYSQSQLLGKRKLHYAPKPETSWIVGAHLNSIGEAESQFQLYQKMYPNVRGMRNLGSITLDLCLMADGVIDVLLNRSCFFWDLAAAHVILEEAGGKLYDFKGNELEFDWVNTKKKYQTFACHPQIKDQVMVYL